MDANKCWLVADTNASIGQYTSSAVKASCQSGSATRTDQARVDHWLKIKNPAAPAVKREAEEDWGNRRGTREEADTDDTP
jgi:hypothetical protein